MKINYFIISLPAAVVGGMAFDILSGNDHAGYTGSPGELLCNDCHITYGASNSGPGTVYITSSMNNFQYVPGHIAII